MIEGSLVSKPEIYNRALLQGPLLITREGLVERILISSP